MKTQISTLFLMAAFVAAAGLLVPGTTMADPSGGTMQHDNAMQHGTMMGNQPMSGQQGMTAEFYTPDLQEAKPMIGWKVIDASGSPIGTIQGLDIDASANNPAYAYVSEPKGGQSYIVPFPALRFDPQSMTARLDVSASAIMNAPSFAKEQWPQMDRPQMRQKVDDFYRTHSSDYGQAMKMYMGAPGMGGSGGMSHAPMREGTPSYYRVGDLIGWKVSTPENKDLGKLTDAVVDMHMGRPVYAQISYGGFVDLGGKTALVPWQVLTPNPDRKTFSGTITKDELQAVTFPKVDQQVLDTPSVAMRIFQTFDREPYWVTYGYVRPGEGNPMGSTKMTGQAEISSLQGWGPASAFVKGFDPRTVETMEGTISAVGAFRPEPNASEGLMFTLKASNGTTYNVQVGPTSYTDQLHMALAKGATVSVTGSLVEVSQQPPVLIAETVKSSGKTYRLRNSSGVPEWQTMMQSK